MREVVAESHPLQFLATALVLLMALLLGGGQGTLGDSATQLLAVGLLSGLAWQRLRDPQRAPLPHWSWLPVLAVVAIPLLQLLPIPLSLWQSLGGRAELTTQLVASGVMPDARIGLNPIGSERALLWLLPGIAIYLSTLSLSSTHKSRLLMLLLGIAAASVILGFAQLASGSESPLRFYANTNPNGMVGFFANRNHAASLFALCLPLAMMFVAKSIARRAEDNSASIARVIITLGLLLLLMLGLAMTRSRAGLLIGMLAMLITLPLLPGLHRGRGLRRALLATGLVASGLIVQFAMLGILQTFAADPLEDRRRAYVDPALQAAATYSSLGSGLETFRQAFQTFERDSATGARNVIIHHAHNDYLELWVEAGWPVVPCAILLLGALAYAGLRSLRHQSDSQRMPRRAAMIALLVPIVHSLFDYPLRTTSHVVAFGLLAGIVAMTEVTQYKRTQSAQSGY